METQRSEPLMRLHHYRKTLHPKLRVYTIAEITEIRSEQSTRYEYHRIFKIAATMPDQAWAIFENHTRKIPGRIYKLIYNPLPNKALNCPVIEL